MSHLLYGYFIDNIDIFQKSKNYKEYEEKYKSGIEIMGMKPNKTKDGKYKCDGVSLVELKEACQKNGIKGYPKCNKTELVKLLMKVDCIEEPKKKKKIIIIKKIAHHVIEEVKPVVAKPVMKAEAEDFKELFGDKFIYCVIHLKTEGFKADGKPRKKATFPVGYDKVEKPTIENFKSGGKDIIPNGIILLQRKNKLFIYRCRYT